MLHEIVHDSLEDYLSGRGKPELISQIRSHLSECPACHQVVSAMELQARWVRILRPAEEVCPTAGFYGRVWERIEQQGAGSLWSFFLGRRLVYASLALLAVLTAAAVTTGDETLMAAEDPVSMLAEQEYPPTPGVDQQLDRDVVLVNLATWGAAPVVAPRAATRQVGLPSDSR